MSDPNKYADLEIRILDQQDGHYPVEITYDGERGRQEFGRGFLDPAQQPQIDWNAPQPTGEKLFAWLFSSDKPKEAWTTARAANVTPRIRLRIDAAATALHTLPWEMLRNPGPPAEDLAAMAAMPFSRYLAGEELQGKPIQKRPIRILVAISSPSDLAQRNLAPVDSDQEWQRMQAAMAGTPGIQLVRLNGPCTLRAIEDGLKAGIHILHFVGHGHYQKDGKAVLLLADDNNNMAMVDDQTIAGMLSRQFAAIGPTSEDRLRLVFLAACQSATRNPMDALRGLAPQLVQAGVPAVVAMQTTVSMEAAAAFSQTFYHELLTHGQVDRASNAARSALLTAKIPGAWIPVLFMRLPTGQLLDSPDKIVGKLPPDAWKDLLDNIAEGICTPILGPGVASDLLPLPEELAAKLADQYVFPFANRSDFLHVSTVIGSLSGGAGLRDKALRVMVQGFRERLGINGPPTSKLSAALAQTGWDKLGERVRTHRQLAALGLPLYITTNFDNLMLLALQANGHPDARRETIGWRNPPATRYDFKPQPEAAKPIVLHLFGTDEDLQSMVLTEDDHLEYLANAAHNHDSFLPNTVNDSLSSNTLLFLGYRLEELSMKVILRGLLRYQNLEFYNRLQLAVQLESSQQSEAAEDEVVRYLQKSIRQCFPKDAEVQIYWGTAQEFMDELTERLKLRAR